MNNFFVLIRLGTQAFFDGRTRDFVHENEYFIQQHVDTEHFLITNKLTGKNHFIPIYNVSYAEFRDEPLPQNDSVKESPNENCGRESEDTGTNQNLPIASAEKKNKKPKKN